jgi:hypothetical protein
MITGMALIVAVLLLTKYVLIRDDETGTNGTQFITRGSDENHIADKNALKSVLSSGIDSVLSCFGIKNEWISAASGSQNKQQKNLNTDSLWFNKTVLIPKDLNTVVVNADISAYLGTLGLSSTVSEDILTKDIVITVTDPDTTSGNIALAKISVIHSDKVTRESAVICIALGGIDDYNNDAIDRLLLNKNEFSFVFPRSLDDIDIQNKLLQNKKDVIIDLTVGGKDNYETDFNTNLDEKGIRDKVKSFTADFPTISTAILTKEDAEVPGRTIEMIAEEFGKFNIKVILYTTLSELVPKEEIKSKDMPAILAANLKTKALLQKTIVTKVEVKAGEFEKFYDEIINLKKLGYKFYNYTDYLNKKAALEKMEELKAEKLRIEQEMKKQAEKKKQLQIKKDTKKKTTDKKSTEKKTTEKKKTTDKKKTDVKKKK